MTFRLHGYWRSSSTWRVRIGLHWKGIPFEHRVVNLLAGEQRREEHLARSPMGHVPLLEVEEGGRTLYLAQSMAILEWLEERVPSPPLLPADPDGRARVRRLTLPADASWLMLLEALEASLTRPRACPSLLPRRASPHTIQCCASSPPESPTVPPSR